MTKTWHKRTAVASMFQNGISRNTKCAERDGFHREGHKLFCICILTLESDKIHIHTCMDACMNTPIHTCMHAHTTHTYTRTHTHTHIHTHTHTIELYTQ